MRRKLIHTCIVTHVLIHLASVISLTKSLKSAQIWKQITYIRGSHYGAKTILARKKCIIGAKETHFPILLSVFFAVIILKHVAEPNKHTRLNNQESETNKKVLTLDQMSNDRLAIVAMLSQLCTCYALAQINKTAQYQ